MFMNPTFTNLEQLLEKLQEKEALLHRRQEELEIAYQEVQAQRLRYQELFDFAPDSYLITDIHGNITEANQAAAILLGSSKSFLVGKPLPLFVVDGQRGGFYLALQEIRRSPHQVRSWEGSLKAFRDREILVSLRVAGQFRGNNELTGFRWVLRDLTEHRQLEYALLLEKDFSEVLLETAQAVILVINEQGIVLRSNLFFSSLLQVPVEEIRGQPWWNFLPESEREKAVEAAGRSLLSGQPQTFTGSLESREDHRNHTIAWSIKAFIHRIESQHALLVIGSDVTELEEAQKHALHKERLAAIGEVMTSLAHECRNGLQRSRACLDRLTWRLQDQAELLDLVHRAINAQKDLTRLFEDVRAYGAPLTLEWKPCNLADIWQEAWAQVAGLFPDREAMLRVQSRGVDLNIEGDRFRLSQVFRNIMENSFAACPGPVIIDIECQDTSLEDRFAVRVTVRDNGPGLDVEQRQRIFEPFFTTKTRGSGLGMAISRRIVRAHGGILAVGKNNLPGAELVLILPRERT